MKEHVDSRVEADRKRKGFRLKIAWNVSRNQLYFSLLVAFILPLTLVTLYAAGFGHSQKILLVTLVSSVVGGGIGWFVLRNWERTMRRSVTHFVEERVRTIEAGSDIQRQIANYQQEIAHLKAHIHEVRLGYEHQIDLMHSSVAKSKDEVHQLHSDMDKKLEEMRVAYLEFEDLRKEYRRLGEELIQEQNEHQIKLTHKDALIGEYQRTISEQRMILEKKQRYIGKLESKVRDLMYEIRSLLQLEESAPPPTMTSSAPRQIQTTTPFDLSLQVQKYIAKAEGLTGAAHFGGDSPRFSYDSFAIDQRRLYDALRDETVGIIFVYSQIDKRFLFVNNHVRSLVGWSPEKFIKDFPHLVSMGYPNWRDALSTAFSMREGHAKVAINSKSGEQKRFECVMGVVSKGPFANHVIGMFANS